MISPGAAWAPRRHVILSTLSAVVLATVSLLVAPPAGAQRAQHSWHFQAVPPPPPGVPHSEFADVSCPTRSFCFGVGQQLNRDAYFRPLVETWNGTRWAIARNPKVAGVRELIATTCVDQSWCVALGDGARTRALRWRAGHWVAQRVENGARAELVSASCITRANCFMVGRIAATVRAARHGRYAKAAAWHWAGQRWQRVAVPDAGRVHFYGVSCGGRASCYAVGGFHATTAPTERTLAELWDGRGLTRMAFSTPTAGFLGSVDCPGTHACTATGDGPPGTAVNDGPLVADLESGIWHITKPRLPSTYPSFGAVSCRAVRVCTVVVSELGSNDDGVSTVAARGRSGPFRLSKHEYNLLRSVSCSSVACTVVGGSVADNRGSGSISDRDRPVALRGAGTALSRQQVPAPQGTGGAVMNSVSCLPGGFCGAITDGVGEGGHSAVYTRSDGRWRVATTKSRTGPTAISCTSSSFCMAISRHSSVRHTGAGWVTSPMPHPDGADEDIMFAVSCVSPTWCQAVGTSGDDAIENRALVQHWNGSAWHVVRVPSLPAGNSAVVLLGVSCTSTSFCLAVGHDVVNSHPLVEQWNGSTWTRVTDAGLPTKAVLDSVSCWTEQRCMMTAQFGRPTPHALIWNGSRFRSTALAAPPKPVSLEVDGVSCVSATSCVAVGADQQRLAPLVEHWNGTRWTLVRGQRFDGYQADFASVSCSAGGCTAVGSVYRNDVFLPTAALVR